MRSEIQFLNKKTNAEARAPDERMVIMSCIVFLALNVSTIPLQQKFCQSFECNGFAFESL